MIYDLDESHNPVPTTDFKCFNKNHVVKKELVGSSEVSTVFLCIDHNYGRIGPPLLFETMVFGPLDPENEIQERCSTWDEALEQHQRIVDKLKVKLN
jgi:hypothetical protein